MEIKKVNDVLNLFESDGIEEYDLVKQIAEIDVMLDSKFFHVTLVILGLSKFSSRSRWSGDSLLTHWSFW